VIEYVIFLRSLAQQCRGGGATEMKFDTRVA